MTNEFWIYPEKISFDDSLELIDYLDDALVRIHKSELGPNKQRVKDILQDAIEKIELILCEDE